MEKLPKQYDSLEVSNSRGTYLTKSHTCKLNIDKVKTLEDVIKIIDALNIQITIFENSTSETYEKLKDYFE